MKHRGDDSTPEAISAWILETFPGTFVAEAMNATFFSCSDRHFPNFATIVTTDEHDHASNLDRPGVFRLNIGLGPATFRRVVGPYLDPEATGYVPRPGIDYTVLDTLLPHPVYAAQRFVCILNPSEATFETVLKPLLVEAHEIVARRESKGRGAS